jgi:hypothetical protein
VGQSLRTFTRRDTPDVDQVWTKMSFQREIRSPNRVPDLRFFGAGDQLRTGDPHLGKEVASDARDLVKCLKDVPHLGFSSLHFRLFADVLWPPAPWEL